MNRFGKQLMLAVLLFSILVLVVTGCVSRPQMPVEDIRARADRAFDDLKAEETQQKSIDSSSEREKEEPIQLDQLEKELSKSVGVATGERPDWVDGESVRYPSSMYLTGVGYSPDRERAEDKARAEIAKTFYSDIDSRTRTYQEYLQTTSDDKTSTTETFDIGQITKVSTQKVLSGVRIVQVYQETEPKPIFYALAVLDRSQSTEILRHKIEDMDQDIQRLLSNAQGEEDKLTKIKYLKEALRGYVLREAYDAELRIVSQLGEGIPSPVNFIEIKDRLSAILLRDFLIALSVKGNRADEIRQALVEGLNQQGFSVCDDFSKASIVVRGSVDIKPFDRGTPEWEYVRWRVYFDLVDQRGGAIFGSVSETGREGHINLSQAENRAVQKIRKTLTTNIAEDITKYIFTH